MARPRYSPAAARDLEDILDYLAGDNPRRARSFVRELRLFCREVATRPCSFPLREELGAGVRLAVDGAYLVLFAERDGAVVIERIIHGARDRKGPVVTGTLIVTAPETPALTAIIADGSERAMRRFLEFFAAAIRNPNTRAAKLSTSCGGREASARAGSRGLTMQASAGLEGTTLGVRIPMQLGRRRGCKRILAPDGSEIVPPSKPQLNGTLIKALARAWRCWRGRRATRCWSGWRPLPTSWAEQRTVPLIR